MKDLLFDVTFENYSTKFVIPGVKHEDLPKLLSQLENARMEKYGEREEAELKIMPHFVEEAANA